MPNEPSAGTARPGDGAPVVRVEGVVRRYGRTLALDGVSLTIGAGEMFALLGPNGAGKTTLISILCTLLAPDGGTATICGHDVTRSPRKARETLGVVFQEPSLDGKLTVEENLDFHGRMYRMPRAQRRARIAEMLELVELSDMRGRIVRSLSPGMKRRLEIARALIHDSRVLILDEPTVGLDPQSRDRIWAYLAEARIRRGMTIIVTTHYIEEVEGCDRICIIDRGKVLALDTPDALRAAHGREVLRVHATDAAAAARLRAVLPQAIEGAAGEIRVVGAERSLMMRLLDAHGADIRDLSVERPTLNSVFLSLTGRDLRDGQKPAPRRAA
ncbi:ABC transporter ATP-binding protein [Halovulum dunhuangense]|uniref:ABC transporter ATP-binding protein n=1 Tax=Halovulum dunhuangense TaxID=1505036 RepID=A0A849L0X0_9RHOB|nr:ABC transporter ATP-binding protein [Halovulum dunhuangense]NNU79926.1 ABC transporter ATP-binding protein [Halovulum dunhuangense]